MSSVEAIMLLKRFSCLLFFVFALSVPVVFADNIVVIYDSSSKNVNQTRYDYAYKNPPRTTLGAYGRYIFSSGGVRYVHSPSELKRARHAARIDYNNRLYEND